jgi:hypothetical protein
MAPSDVYGGFIFTGLTDILAFDFCHSVIIEEKNALGQMERFESFSFSLS